jgi:uncharacterized protein YoxC
MVSPETRENTSEIKAPRRYRETFFERLAFGAAENMGSVPSLVLHTLFFAGAFALRWFDFALDQILLLLTTVVSLEAIYMAIFIQMTVNRHARELSEVQEDIDEIQEDVEDIAEDVDDIAEDIDEIQEDIDEIQEDVDDIAEDVDELSEQEIAEASRLKQKSLGKNESELSASKSGNVSDHARQLEGMKKTLRKLLKEIETMK